MTSPPFNMRRRKPLHGTAPFWIVLYCAVTAGAADVRIKDISTIEGRRINQLTGVGLVTGLKGTGGQTPATREFALNLLQRIGLRTDPQLQANIRNDSKVRTNNLSVVTVTAELPTEKRPGSKIDVTVAALDDATSLQGGILQLTPLFGVNDEVYVVASGAVSIGGGFSFEGDAASVQKNHPTSGRVPMGGVVELETCSAIGEQGFIRLLLGDPDFATASRTAAAVNEFAPRAARPIDAGTVHVTVPEEFRQDVPQFIAAIEELIVQPDGKAVVVINERTGTVIVGEHVRLSRVLITHANLAVSTAEFPQVSQPAPFSPRGQTVVVPRSQVDVLEENKPVNVLEESATVAELAHALNALGVTPRDMSAIFQALKSSGALQAELRFE